MRYYPCRACGADQHPTAEGFRPDGWYEVRIGGRYGDTDLQPGMYCSLDCLVENALWHGYGIHGDQARAFLGVER